MAFINSVVPNIHDPVRRLLLENDLLQFKISQLEKSERGYQKELENIFASVKENGYVFLKREESGETLKLVQEVKK